MFDRILIREIRDCLICKMKGPHCRVRSKEDSSRHGWECETCGSIRMDGKKRG